MNTGLIRGFSGISSTATTPPPFVAAGSASGATIAIPSGAAVGDIAIYCGASGSAGMTAPSGWNTAYNDSTGSTPGPDKTAVFWKRLASGELGTNITATGAQVSTVSVYRGSTDPAVSSSTASATSSIAVPSVSSLSPGVRVVKAVGTVKGGSSGTGQPEFPSSTSRASRGASFWSVGLGDITPTAGTVAAETITSGGEAVHMRGVQLSLTGT